MQGGFINFLSRKKSHDKALRVSGFSLVETMVSIALIVFLMVSVYSLIVQSLKITNENKTRLAAIVIANQKIERLRNLPYDDVRTILGIPGGGPILDDEVVISNNGRFDVNTVIVYEDDPFDGTALAGTDSLPTDYKSARVRVRWTGFLGLREVSAFTKIAPRGMEAAAGGGTLVITIFNASGQPVNLADVRVENPTALPPIDATYQTATSGQVLIYGAPEAIEGYEITVTKTGYSTSSTTARTAGNPNPTQVNVTVLEGLKTEVSYAIDLVSTLRIHTVHQDLPGNWKINTDPNTENQINARLAIDSGNNTYIVWQDYGHSSASKIYAQKYNSAKVAQWDSGVDKVIGTANNQILPDILIDNATNAVYMAWNDDSNGNQDSFIVKLSTATGNEIWIGSKKVETIGADNADQSKPRIALSGGADLTVVWQDNRAGDTDIYTRRYNPDKTTAWNEIKVNTDGGSTNQTLPVVVTDSEDFTNIAWTDERNGNKDIYMQRLSASGNLEWIDMQINADGGSTDQYAPTIAIDSLDNIYVAWTDERNGNQDVYLAKFASTSARVWPSDLLVNSDGGSTHQSEPSIAIDSTDTIYVAWTDERNGNKDIYAQKLDVAGNSLWATDLRVNINADASSQSVPDISINPSTGKPYASWQDDRNGDLDIYATEFDYYGGTTTVASVNITITGAKRIGESPVIYKYARNFTTDSSGIATITGIEWDSYAITLTTPAAYTILLAEPAIPVNVAPGSILESYLYLE